MHLLCIAYLVTQSHCGIDTPDTYLMSNHAETKQTFQQLDYRIPILRETISQNLVLNSLLNNQVATIPSEPVSLPQVSMAIPKPKPKIAPLPEPSKYFPPVPKLDAKLTAPKPTTQEVEPLEVGYASGATRGLERIFDDVMKKTYKGKERNLYVLAKGSEDMTCILPNKTIMGVVKKVRTRFGKAVIINSAYRSPSYNRKVNGAKESMHMKCLALDVSVPGVSKESMRNFLRAQPEVGGVGIYSSGYVHFDLGRKRDWDWRVGTTKQRLFTKVSSKKRRYK